MTLAEAVEAFERDFVVSTAEGYPTEGGGVERLDMDRAPCGDRYVVLWAGGEREAGEPPAAWFGGEEAAASAWLRSAWSYAERRGGKELFWRERPIYREHEYVAMDQAGLMGDPSMRGAITLRIGCIYSRLAISRGEKAEA